MITDQLNTGLISAMKEKLPQGTNLANLLMDILYIGKEAVYRRLRGEVPFTLAEAAVISQKIGISLDRITGTTFRGNALFDLNLTHYDNPIETYYGIIEHYAKIFSVIKEEPESELNTSSNIIPQTIYLKYPLLSKFRMFKWIYQHSQQNNTQCYEQLELPDKLLDRQREFVSETQFVRNTYYILDSMVFRYLTNDIRYFIDSHLITDENVRNLREELLELVDELEHIATVGAFETGREVQFYVSNINFEATYSYVESQQHCLSLIRVFAINSITSIDPEVFKQVKEWIQSLKKFSTQRRDAAAPIFQPTARNHRHPLIRTPITAAPHIRNHVANFATTRDAAHLIFDFRPPSQPRRQNQNLPQRVKLPPRNSFPVKKPHLCKKVRKVLHTRHPMRKTHRGRA